MKASTAIIIVLTFFFRLLFVNGYLYAATPASPVGIHKKTVHISTNFKRRREVQITSSFNLKEFAAAELCEEEDSDGEEKLKLNSPVLLSFISSFFKGKINAPEWADVFDSIKCSLYPKRYLSLSILRI